MVVAKLAEMGFRDLTLASSSLIDAHWPLIEHIKNGVIRQIYTSGLRGKLGEDLRRPDGKSGADPLSRWSRTADPKR